MFVEGKQEGRQMRRLTAAKRGSQRTANGMKGDEEEEEKMTGNLV